MEVVIREGRGSVSLLQRALGVGYGRGARLIDFMAEDGVVGQYAGSQAREVLLTMDDWAARTGTEPTPPDPPPRRLKIQPHAREPAARTASRDHTDFDPNALETVVQADWEDEDSDDELWSKGDADD